MTRRRTPGSRRERLWYKVYRWRMRKGLEHCRVCFTGSVGARLTWEHIKPLALGGRSGMDNTTITCETCNTMKGDEDWTGLILSLADECRTIGLPDCHPNVIERWRHYMVREEN